MLEIVAMVTMLADHVGLIFFPDQIWMRMVGRLAMPLYAYGVVAGYQHTRSLRSYAFRLLGVAAAAQIFYAPLFDAREINIVFGFLGGIGVFWCLDRARDWAIRQFGIPYGRWLAWMLQAWIVLGGFALFTVVPVDYGPYLLALLLLYRCVKHRWLWPLAHAGLNLLFFGPLALQGLSTAATLLLALPVHYPRLQSGRWFYRIFYPAHLAVLLLVSAATG